MYLQLEQTVSSETAGRRLATCCNQAETVSKTTVDNVGWMHSKLPMLLSDLNRIEESNEREDCSSLITNCQHELKELSDHLDVVVTGTDQVGNESTDKYVEKLDNETAVTWNEDCVSQLHLENHFLQIRLKEVLLENQKLTVDMENVKQLIAASHELKSENEALLRECRDFKQQVLNNKCSDCLKLIYQNKLSTSLASNTGKTHLDENRHAESVSKLYLACKQSRHTESFVGTDPDKLQSELALENTFKTRLQKKAIDDGSEGTTAKSKHETETESDHSADAGYYETTYEPSYLERHEEFEAETAVAQRNFVQNTEVAREIDRMILENNQMIKTIVDLRTKMNQKTGEVASLNRKLVDLERKLFEQMENFNLVPINMVSNSHEGRKLKSIAEEDNVEILASAGPQKSERRSSKVMVGGYSTSGDCLNQGAFSTSEHSEKSPACPSKSENDDDYDSPVCEISRWNVSDTLAGSPVHHHKDYVLLPKHYVQDLLAEIAALKRTVLEQSRYLQTADTGSAVATEVCFVNGETTDKPEIFDSSERFRSSEELLEQEEPLQKCDACLQTDETDIKRKINSDEETMNKYNVLLANLRKTYDLANAFQTGKDSCELSPKICDEDYLSVDELLLLINSFEQLNNEKKMLEDENQILGMEIDQLTSRLMKAEREAMRLPPISEENYEERSAEMADRLDVKEAELFERQKVVAKTYNSEKICREKFMALQEGREIAEKIADVKAKDFEHLECEETATTGENNASFRVTNLQTPITTVSSELLVRFTEHHEYKYIESRDELRRKSLEKSSLLLLSEQIIIDDKEAEGRRAVHLNKKQRLITELCKLGPDLREIKASLGPETARLEAENGRLREEVVKRKRLKQLQVNDAEFCVQERLAFEVEQLGQRLDSTNSELAARSTAYCQLQEAYRHLEWENEQLVSRLSTGDGERSTEHIGIDFSVFEKLLRVANSNLVDENMRLAELLETEDHKIRTSNLNLSKIVADEKTQDCNSCNGGVSTNGQPQMHDFTSRRRTAENDANTNSSDARQQQEAITQSFVPETVTGVYEMRNGDGELLQSQSAAVAQQTVIANDSLVSSSRPASTSADAAADRPVAQDLVSSSDIILLCDQSSE